MNALTTLVQTLAIGFVKGLGFGVGVAVVLAVAC